MDEFTLKARWVYLGERRPPMDVTVLAREPVYENGLMKGEYAYYSLEINDEYEYGVLNDRHERKKEYTLGPIEWNQGNFEWLEVIEDEGGE